MSHGRLIDSDALLAELEVDPVEEYGCPEPEFLKEFRDLLEGYPTADVEEVKTGRWEPRKVYDDSGDYIVERFCSCCGHDAYFRYDDPDELYEDGYYELFDYCPYCGARMKEGK